MPAPPCSLYVPAPADGAAFDAEFGAASSTAAPPDSPCESPGWLRIVGYDERLGPLDRDRLDRLALERKRPVNLALLRTLLDGAARDRPAAPAGAGGPGSGPASLR